MGGINPDGQFGQDGRLNEILKADNLFKSFGKVQALAGVDISVRPGEILGILGPNGSGKTTSSWTRVGPRL